MDSVPPQALFWGQSSLDMVPWPSHILREGLVKDDVRIDSDERWGARGLYLGVLRSDRVLFLEALRCPPPHSINRG